MPSIIDFLKQENPLVSDIKNINQLSEKDICELAHIYQEILDLEKKYKQATLGRRQIAEEIKKKSKLIQRFLFYINSNLRHINEKYEYEENYINDFEKAIRIILKLANKEENKYSLVKLHIKDKATFEIIHGDREEISTDGIVLIITRKDVIDNIDDKMIYRAHEIGEITSQIFNQKISLIVLTDFYCDKLLKPNTFGNKPTLGEQKINADNLVGGISCYFFDNELLNAVNDFMTFIQKNGADIRDLNEDIIVQNINTPRNDKLVRIKNGQLDFNSSDC